MRARAHEPGHPVHGAQLIEDRPADARRAEGFELHAAVEVEGLDGVLEAEDAGLHEVVEFHFIGQLGVDALRVVLDHGDVLQHQEVAQLLGLVPFEGFPDVVDVLLDGGRGGVSLRHMGRSLTL